MGRGAQALPGSVCSCQILNSHREGNKEVVDEVAIERSIRDPKEATSQLVRSKGNTLVYHTGNEKMVLEIRDRPGLRGAI